MTSRPEYAVLGAAWIFRVGEDLLLAPTQAHGLGQRPGAVGIEGDAGRGKAFRQRSSRRHLLFAVQHATL